MRKKNSCLESMEVSKIELDYSCVGEDAFNLEDYSGRFNNTFLEPNVRDVVDMPALGKGGRVVPVHQLIQIVGNA